MGKIWITFSVCLINDYEYFFGKTFIFRTSTYLVLMLMIITYSLKLLKLKYLYIIRLIFTHFITNFNTTNFSCVHFQSSIIPILYFSRLLRVIDVDSFIYRSYMIHIKIREKMVMDFFFVPSFKNGKMAGNLQRQLGKRRFVFTYSFSTCVYFKYAGIQTSTNNYVYFPY